MGADTAKWKPHGVPGLPTAEATLFDCCLGGDAPLALSLLPQCRLNTWVGHWQWICCDPHHLVANGYNTFSPNQSWDSKSQFDQ